MTSVPQRVGNYRIEKPIGKGGTSQVVLARHGTLEDRLVAIKLLMSQDPEYIERFQREANIASRLRHPNIVQIYDHGYHAPFHYTVMEYVAGGALRAQFQAAKRLPLDIALHIFKSVGQALDYAHSHGIVHRDVSPGNILLEQPGGRVLLTDFGIARDTGKTGVTTIGNVMGTPGYLSPEHAMSATAVTHLSDIYSIGIILFELLSGKSPWDHFPGMGPDHHGGPFIPTKTLRERGADLPPDVEVVIQTLLAKDPAKRYPTVAAAIEDLERILHRHTSPTVVVMPGQGETIPSRPGDRARPVAAPLPPPLAREVHPVERALALDLLKGPMQEARRRAESLSDPNEVAALLDRWSADSRFRRRLLGRQATIRRSESVNIYFYTLKVLYETRTQAAEVEEPDYKAVQIKLEKELDPWAVKLSEPADLKDDPGGTVRLPGSVRVIDCLQCKSLGRTVCPKCEGRGRIMKASDQQPPGPEQGLGRSTSPGLPTGPAPGAPGQLPGSAGPTAAPRPAGPTLVPCPECSGSGGLRCRHCDGVGRMLQHKSTTWSRRAAEFNNQDDLPQVDENWLLKSCKLREIYTEQQRDGFRPQWQQVPMLADLITRAQAGTGSNTRIVLSQVQINFIPVTEIVFDLGENVLPAQPQGKGKPPKKSKRGDSGFYSWYIYGFERRLPRDWRFLHWYQVMFYCTLAIAIILAILLVFALLRIQGVIPGVL